MTWNYRIIKRASENEPEYYYALNEVFYLISPKSPETKVSKVSEIITPDTTIANETSLETLSLTALKALAKDRKVKGYSKKTKAELINLLS